MGLTDTAEQAALAATVRQLVSTHSPMRRVRQVLDGDTAFDPDLWRRLADLGLPGITIPEAYGGAGGSLADLAPALRELGRGLVPSPLVGSGVLAAHALLSLDEEPLKKKLLPQIATGELLGTLAVSEPGSDGWTDRRPSTTAAGRPEGTVLNGTKHAVLNAAQTDLFLVHAHDGERNGIFLVRHDAPGIVVTPEPKLDRTTATGTISFNRTPAERVSGDADAALDRVTDLAGIALACMQSAAMKKALDLTADYAKVRYSFGQPIGSYQGVKHKLADIYTDWCLVDAATRRAVEAADSGEPDASACAAAARLLASPAYVKAARQMMMLHGGIGFTWEHDAHLFYKNAVSDSILLGDPGFQRRRLARLLAV
ncbi:acyl-CoA dehydrogenase family protein [Amycolatopsis pigmentata]|uniref:Acyl-CoA dehydrogenase family protein n=1 Tax=Amycolatopsis pigmentata TaxID=450801 RepID=A0ABW5G6B6_9PSEU